MANAMCAVATCSLLGISPDESCMALQSFLGAKRRLEVLGQKSNIPVIDDFAHNPDKVLASMSALKSYDGRLLIMFQPHGFSPMHFMGKQIIESFCKTMDDNDILIMPEIYFAGGTVNKDISSEDFIKMAIEKNKKAYFFPTRQTVKQFILQQAQTGDRIVIMGARDNTLPEFCQEILKRFPLEAKISPYFEVMDERSSRDALSDIKKDMLNNNSSKEVAEALSFLISASKAGSRWKSILKNTASTP